MISDTHTRAPVTSPSSSVRARRASRQERTSTSAPPPVPSPSSVEWAQSRTGAERRPRARRRPRRAARRRTAASARGARSSSTTVASCSSNVAARGQPRMSWRRSLVSTTRPEGVDLEHADRDGLEPGAPAGARGPAERLRWPRARSCRCGRTEERSPASRGRTPSASSPDGTDDHAQVDAVAPAGVEEVHDHRSPGVRGEADRRPGGPHGAGPLPGVDDHDPVGGDDDVERRPGPDDAVARRAGPTPASPP